jgi:hypothetical protein
MMMHIHLQSMPKKNNFIELVESAIEFLSFEKAEFSIEAILQSNTQLCKGAKNPEFEDALSLRIRDFIERNILGTEVKYFSDLFLDSKNYNLQRKRIFELGSKPFFTDNNALLKKNYIIIIELLSNYSNSNQSTKTEGDYKDRKMERNENLLYIHNKIVNGLIEKIKFACIAHETYQFELNPRPNASSPNLLNNYINNLLPILVKLIRETQKIKETIISDPACKEVKMIYESDSTSMKSFEVYRNNYNSAFE